MPRVGAAQHRAVNNGRIPRRRVKATKEVVRRALELRASGMTFADVGRAIGTGASAPQYWWNLHAEIGDAMFDTLEFEDPTQRVKVPALRYRWHEYDADTWERLRVWLGEVTG